MKKLFLVRFGSAPNPAVSQALKPHIVGPAFAAPIPGAILSVFNTQSSEEEITQDVKETGATFFLMEETKVNLNLPEALMQAINAVLQTAAQTATPDLTVDEILDKISRSGVESLTQREKEILQRGL
jgi:DNA-binding NarL/FixJ family response regulator